MVVPGLGADLGDTALGDTGPGETGRELQAADTALEDFDRELRPTADRAIVDRDPADMAIAQKAPRKQLTFQQIATAVS